MHASARKGLLRVLGGAAALAVAIVALLLVLRGCRTDEERLSEMVDDGRDALVDRRHDEFLAFFTDDLRYGPRKDRAGLERDLADWERYRGGRIAILDREIVVDGDRAKIRLRCDLGMFLQSMMEVDVDLEARRTPEGWKVYSFDWKRK